MQVLTSVGKLLYNVTLCLLPKTYQHDVLRAYHALQTKRLSSMCQTIFRVIRPSEPPQQIQEPRLTGPESNPGVSRYQHKSPRTLQESLFLVEHAHDASRTSHGTVCRGCLSYSHRSRMLLPYSLNRSVVTTGFARDRIFQESIAPLRQLKLSQRWDGRSASLRGTGISPHPWRT